jgi:iron complex transport system ATP-binding protein
MITLSGVQFAYNGFPVIKGITHSFEKGSFTALLGPNGSGKSTLLRLINGILTPQTGTVEVMGRSAGSISAREMAREMAYVPQMQYNTFPATVFDTVLLGRNPYISWSPGKDDRMITAEILVRLGLDDIALKDLNKLSGGQRQQVFIARALAQQPAVILLDEPTANLDLRHQHEILRLLAELAAGGITVLVAIHDLNLALKYCSEFIILDDGQVRAEGGSEIFSEKLIEDIYGVRIKIIRHEGEMFILPTEPL